MSDDDDPYAEAYDTAAPEAVKAPNARAPMPAVVSMRQPAPMVPRANISMRQPAAAMGAPQMAGRDDMTVTPGKIFLGGVAFTTTENDLQEHFSQFGTVTDVIIMKDKFTGKPRGFGFITFADSKAVDTLLKAPQRVGGRVLDIKRAVPRNVAPPPTSAGRRRVSAPGSASMSNVWMGTSEAAHWPRGDVGSRGDSPRATARSAENSVTLCPTSEWM